MATYTNTGTFVATFYANTTPAPTATIITWAAEMAYAYINARLHEVYAVPFVSTPDLILKISDLLTRCGVGKLSRGTTPTLPKAQKREAIMDECALAVVMLDDIASLKAALPGVPPLAGSTGVHTRDGYTPVFDMDDPINHQPDPDLIDAIESERSS